MGRKVFFLCKKDEDDEIKTSGWKTTEDNAIYVHSLINFFDCCKFFFYYFKHFLFFSGHLLIYFRKVMMMMMAEGFLEFLIEAIEEEIKKINNLV